MKRRLSKLRGPLLVFILVPLILYLVLAYPLASHPRLVPRAMREAKSMLLAVAHPDDESLFFAPTILGTVRANPHLSQGVLVFSSGDYNGIGERRKNELQASCHVFGIPPNKCVVRSELQDNPKEWWNATIIKDVLTQYIAWWEVDLIVTFDSGGVSGHINHRAVSLAIRYENSSKSGRVRCQDTVLGLQHAKEYVSDHAGFPPTYALRSTALVWKYASLVDIIPTTGRFFMQAREKASKDSPSNRALFVSDWGSYLRSREAFRQHWSQYSWDRVLYLIMSRFMWLNDLLKMDPAEGI